MDRFEAQSFLNQLIHYILYEPLVRTTDFYHPDFIGQHHLESFNLDVLIERFHYFRKRYNHMECELVEFEVLKDNTIFSFVDFTAFDKNLNMPIELFLAHILILEKGKIKQSYALSKYKMVMKSLQEREDEENFSIQRTARGHFEKTLKLVNQETQKDIQLTAREIDCLYYYVSGLSSKESAKKVGISFRTVEKHLENIKLKYQLSSVRDLKNMFQVI